VLKIVSCKVERVDLQRLKYLEEFDWSGNERLVEVDVRGLQNLK
jgi:hypothetical protein